MKTVILAIGIILIGISVYSQSTISYTYDKQGRLTTEEYKSVYKIQLLYDQEGNFINKSVTNYTSITSSENLEKYNGYKLYPNPADDKVFIEVQGINDIKNIRIYDVSGRIVREIDDSGNIIAIPVHDLLSSVYIVSIQSAGKTAMLKFLKKY